MNYNDLPDPEMAEEHLRECLISTEHRNHNEEPANVVDGLFAIARGLDNVAHSLRMLGNANAATEMGAIEALGVVMKEGFDRIGGSLEYLKGDD